MTNNLREVIRLIGKTNFSNHAIGRLTGFSHNTISKYRQKLRDNGRQIDAVLEFNDRQLKAMFVGARGFSAEKRMPDWNFIHSKMQARHQTLIQLWEEYCLENTSDAYSYSQFTYYYRDYISRIDVCMRQVYYAGHTGLVDYAGRTIEWYDHKNKTSKHAQIFIGVLGCSNYTFVHASDSQKLEHWIDSHARMFEYFGGVPYVIISDNLKSAVTKPGPFPVINRSYLECIRHYGTAIDPARAGRPQDKAKVEGAVLCVSRWIIAVLSQRQFFSIDEINIAILELLEKFNNRKFKRLPGTRRSRFEELDKPLLKPLPLEPFQYSEWVYYFSIIKSDFFAYFKLPKVNRRLPVDVPDEVEMEQVLRQAMTRGKMAVRDRAILEVYYATGVRRTELANLDIKDIDFKHQLVTVRKGKGSLDRRVPIATRALNWVRQYLKELRPNLQNLDSGEALFLGKTGKRIRPSKLSDMVSNCVRRSGIGKSGSCHIFRHASATGMLRNGADIRYVQEMLGHLDITSTQIYTRVTVMDLARVYNETHPAARS